MRRYILRFLANFTFRRAGIVLTLMLAASVAAGWALKGMHFDTNLIAFMPPASPQARHIREIVSDYRNLEPVMAVIRAREPGHKAELIRIAEKLADWADSREHFSTTVYKVDELAQSYYESLSDIRLIQLLTPDDWVELKDRMEARITTDWLQKLRAYRLSALVPQGFSPDPAQDPLGALEAIRRRMVYSRGPTRLDPSDDGYFLSPDGRAITVLMYPVAAPEEGRAARRTMRFLDRCRDNLMQRNPAWRELVEIEFSGSHATTVAHLDRMRHDLRLIFKLSPPLAILLLLLVFRKLEVIFFIALPPVLGLLWTLGMASWAFGEISVVTAALLLMNFAIGLQYNLHLYHRFTLELYRTQNYYRALTRSHQETGRGVLASAVVVALLFTLLFATSQLGVEDWRGLVHNLSDARGFGQLGLVAAGGILLNLAACLLTIPALAAIKHLLARGRIKPVGLFHFHLSRLYEPALSKPRAMLGVMLLISVFLGYRALELEFRPRFAAISPFFFRTEPAEEIVAAETSVPRPGRPIIALVNGPSLQEVLERNDRLYKNLRSLKGSYNILAYDSLRTTLPSIRSQIASLDELAQLDLKPLSRATQKASRSVGLKPTVYEPFLEALRSFKEQAATPDFLDFTLDEDDVFIATVQRYITHKASKRYYVATAIYPHANGFNPWRIRPLEEELRSGVGELEFIGDPVFERALSRLFKFNLAIMILLSAVTIAVALVLHFHGLRVALLTFVPILAAIIWVCGLMSLAGLGIHFFTILPIPLLLSLGMDNALQLTQYLDDRRPCTVRQAMASVGRVPVLTCGMMALLLGTLSLASHPGLRNFGQVVLMGSGAVLIATVMLQPALLQLLGKGQSWRGALGVEEDNSGEP